MNHMEFTAARHRMGLTQKQLADNLGISGRQVSYLETGKKPIQTQTELAMKYLQGVIAKDVPAR